MSAEHRRILSALITVGVFVALAKGVGAAKEVVVAAHFGTGRVIDAYAFLLSLVTWPAAAWTSTVSALLIPLLVRLDLEAPGSARQFRREALGLALWSSCTTGGLVYLVLRLGLRSNFFQLPPEVSSAARGMLALMAACTPAMMIVGVLAAFLMAGRQHTNSLLEAVTPLVIGVVVLAASGAPAWGLPLGTFLGYAVQAALSACLQPREMGFPLPSFAMSSPVWRAFWSGFALLLLSQLILAAAAVIDQTMVARLGPSANATLAYANRLTSLVLALGATVIARATLPVLSEARFHEAGREWTIARRWVQLLFILGILAVIVGWVLAPLGVRLLLQHGAFTSRDAALVSQLVRFSLLQLPFYLAGIVLAQIVSSAALYRTFLVGNVINLAVKVTFNLLLIPRLGLIGAMLSTAAMQLASLLFLWVVSARRYAQAA